MTLLEINSSPLETSKSSPMATSSAKLKNRSCFTFVQLVYTLKYSKSI